MGLKGIKQQHPHAMTEEESVKHLKDQLFPQAIAMGQDIGYNQSIRN